MGLAGRRRVEEHFSWTSIAAKTRRMYEELLTEKGKLPRHLSPSLLSTSVQEIARAWEMLPAAVPE
jgi:hypothetical protein